VDAEVGEPQGLSECRTMAELYCRTVGSTRPCPAVAWFGSKPDAYNVTCPTARLAPRWRVSDLAGMKDEYVIVIK
jgi:hypothetical protein